MDISPSTSTDLRWESPSASPAPQRALNGIFAALERIEARLEESIKSLHQQLDAFEAAHECQAKRPKLDSTEHQNVEKKPSFSKWP